MTSKCEIDALGNKLWYNSKGHLHHVDGPAVECSDGSKVWYLNGKCHRLDGPAMETAKGNKLWYINGVNYTYSEWIIEVRKKKLVIL